MLSRMSRALAFTPAIRDSADPGDASPTAGLIRGNLAQWPALDSIYVGYDNGYWLQVQRLDGLKGGQRERVLAVRPRRRTPRRSHDGLAAKSCHRQPAPSWTRSGNEIGRMEIPPRG